jgi:class 3 adenylate cyclase
MLFLLPVPDDGVIAALECPAVSVPSCRTPTSVCTRGGRVPGGDYFGRTVNVAARIAEQAKPGPVLVTQEVVDRIGPGDVVFEPIGSFLLEGVSEPVLLHAALRS